MLRSNLKSSIALCLSLVLMLSSLFTALQAGVQTAEAAVTLPDQVYPVKYRYVKDGMASDSAANMYLSIPNSGKLIVQNGKITFEHEITPHYYGYFQYIAFRNAGAAKAVINTSTNTVQGTEGYTPFPVRNADNGSGNLITTIHIEDITKKQDVLMHVVIKNAPEFGTGFVYDYWYNVQLDIDTSTLPLQGDTGGGNGGETTPPLTITDLQQLVTVSKSVYQATYEGTSLGDVQAGARQPFYLKIVQAETFIHSGDTQADHVKTAYNDLAAALEKFKSLIYSADKKVLGSLIAAVTVFRDDMKEIGYYDDQLGSNLAPASPGEFIVGPKNSTLTTALQNAQAVYDNTKATQTQVDDAVRVLTGQYNSVKDSYYYVSAGQVKVIALDSLTQTTTVPSTAFPEIGGTAAYIKLKANDLGTRANITFHTTSTVTDVKMPNVSSNGSFTTAEFSVPQVLKSSNDRQQMYQTTIRRSNVDETTKWLGHSYLRYKLGGVTKVVYLSFNADMMDALSASAAAAQKLTVEATAVPGAENAYNTAKADLLNKITEAKTVAQNLISTRPQLNAAGIALAQAVAAFKETAAYPLYYSSVHATSDTFSSVDSYFLKPAAITTAGGATYASFTIKDSSIIKELQVKSGGQYAAGNVVSEDTASNTRVVSFKVDSLSALNDAKVRVVIPAQNYDQTHDIRLNFNNVDNSVLSQAVSEANTLYRTSEAGTAPGQYPASAKAALQTAVTTAGAEASRLTGTAELTSAALQALQQAVAAFKASVIVENTDPGTIPDGTYPLGFMIYKKGSGEQSVMYDYVDAQSGQLTVSGGQKSVSFTLKQDAEIKSFKTEVNGVLTETETVNRDTSANKRVVKFPVTDLNSRLNGWVKIYWVLPEPIGIYDHEYEVELGFNFQMPAVDKTQLTTLIADANTKLAAAVEGTSAGQYAIGSKAALQSAISAAEAVAAKAEATQQAVNGAVTALKRAVAVFLASAVLADNSYTFSWPSDITDGAGFPLTSLVSTGAGLKVSGGKQIVTMTLLPGVTFKKLQIKKADGTLEDASTLAAAKQAGVVRALAAGDTPTTIQFEITGRSAVYVLSLLDADQNERSFSLDFSQVSLTPPTNPGTGTGGSGNGTNTGSSNGGGGGGAVIKTFAETLKAGKYTMEYTLYKAGTSQPSEADAYFRHPIMLEVAGGKSYVDLTVSSKEVTDLKVFGSSGTAAAPQVVSSNDLLGEKTMRFEITNAQTKVWIQFKLTAAGQAATDVEAQIAFDEASIRAVQPETASPGTPVVAITDLNNHWAKANVEQAIALGIVNGYEDGTFRPDALINRAEFMTLLNKALKLGTSAGELSFTDSASIPQWVKPYLAPVVQSGIVSGYEDGTFRASRSISRAELAVVLANALKLNADPQAKAQFADAASIPQWAQAAVAAAQKQGLISGRDNNVFAPNDHATRAEAVTLILNLSRAAAKK